MQRREFIALLGSVAIAVPRNAVAQTPSKVYRLALVSPQGLMAESHPNAKFLLTALAQHGYMLGQNLVFDGPPGVPGQAIPPSQLMKQLKTDNVDIIVA